MTLRRVTGRVSVTREDDLDDHGAFVLDYGRQENLIANEPVVAVVLSQSRLQKLVPPLDRCQQRSDSDPGQRSDVDPLRRHDRC